MTTHQHTSLGRAWGIPVSSITSIDLSITYRAGTIHRTARLISRVSCRSRVRAIVKCTICRDRIAWSRIAWSRIAWSRIARSRIARGRIA